MSDEVTREVMRSEFSPVSGVRLETAYIGIRRQRVTFPQDALERLIADCLDRVFKASLVQHKSWTCEFEWDELDGKVSCQVSIEQVIEHRPDDAPTEE